MQKIDYNERKYIYITVSISFHFMYGTQEVWHKWTLFYIIMENSKPNDQVSSQVKYVIRINDGRGKKIELNWSYQRREEKNKLGGNHKSRKRLECRELCNHTVHLFCHSKLHCSFCTLQRCIVRLRHMKEWKPVKNK